MLLVPLKALRPAMVLAQPVCHPASDDLILLNLDYKLDWGMIKRLEDFGITHVWIKVPGLEEIDERVASYKLTRSHTELVALLNSSVSKYEKRLALKVNVAQYKRVVAQMLAEIIEDPGHDVLTHNLTTCGPLLSGHSANVCYLSLLIGAHMTGYLRRERSALPANIAENTTSLGMGALLHDVGKMYMVPELQAVSVLSEESQWSEYRAHAQAGYEEVREHISVLASSVVLNHHQRFDGQGFPARRRRGELSPPQTQTGHEIHIFSRIVAAVDAFDHLLCTDGAVLPTIIAVHALRSRGFQGWFDPVVVETLLRLVPVFMVGSIVTLSDGSEAVVVANHPEAPCKPTVKLLTRPSESSGFQVRGKQLDLRMSRHLTVGAVEGFDVRSYLFDGEFELQGAESAATV